MNCNHSVYDRMMLVSSFPPNASRQVSLHDAGRERTPRRLRQEPARSSGWINPRARAQASAEEAPLFSALYLASQQPMGQQWDVDFLSMEIGPGRHPFSDSWEVGGSINRPTDSDF